MNITRENIDDLNAVVRLTVEKNDYEATVNETLKDYRKKANMPGFRKGKVPAGIIKKMYGKALLAEEVNKILSRELMKYISEEKLDILGEPLPNEEKQPAIDWDNDQNFEFVFDIAMSPEINVTLDKRRKLPYYEIKVDEDLIDKQVESYTNRFGTNVAADEVGEKETVRGDFAELDAEGNLVEGGITANDVLVSIDLIKNEDIKKQFLGAKVGDVIRFDPKVAFENDHEVGHMLNLDHDASHELNAEFNYTINVINTFVPAEVNEEMVTKIYGEESEVKSVEDMRNKIAEELKENLKYSSDYRFLVDAKEVLTKSAKIELPEAFLKRWLVATNENLTAEQIEGDFEHFRMDLEWQLIKNKLGKESELKVEEGEIREMAREMALMQFRQYGMMNVPDEHLDQFANSILQNEEERRRMIEKKLEDKILEVIKEKVNVEEKEVTQEEFDKLFEK